MNTVINHSDLWVMAAEGDHDAYATLHGCLFAGLYNYLFQMIKDEDIVNDLLQELFIKLWQKRQQIGIVKNVKSYFFTSARYMAINHFRLVKSQNSKLENFREPEMDFSPEDILVFTEDTAELKNQVARSLNLLPMRQREIIYLKFYEDMDYQKIAEVTGIQYQSVINHIFRALQTLRTAMKTIKHQNIYAYSMIEY